MYVSLVSSNGILTCRVSSAAGYLQNEPEDAGRGGAAHGGRHDPGACAQGVPHAAHHGLPLHRRTAAVQGKHQ